MSRGLIKIGVGVVAVGVLLAILGVLVVHARTKGKLSYCRNNLRRLGVMAHNELFRSPEEPPEERGRAFWQWIRESSYYNPGKKQWVRRSQLNPFGCPVRGTQPLDLIALDDQEYARVMSDLGTIDYRGPKNLPTPMTGRLVLGADRVDNHPGGGGFVLFADLSIGEKQPGAIDVKEGADFWKQAAAETSD